MNKFNYIKIEMCTAKNEDFKNQSDEKTASVELIGVRAEPAYVQ